MCLWIRGKFVGAEELNARRLLTNTPDTFVNLPECCCGWLPTVCLCRWCCRDDTWSDTCHATHIVTTHYKAPRGQSYR